MANYSLDNLINFAVAVTREQQNFDSKVIATNILKIYKISKSVAKRNENFHRFDWAQREEYVIRTKDLEAKAMTLAREIGLKLAAQSNPGAWPFSISIKNVLWNIG